MMRPTSVKEAAERAWRVPESATARLPDVSAADPIPVRRRALFDRIVVMDPQQLAAMERCASMVEGTR